MNPDWSDAQKALYAKLEGALYDVIEFTGKEPPKLGNKGTPQIVDMAGRCNELRKASKKVEDILKTVVDSRLKDQEESEVLHGDEYVLTYEAGIVSKRLNQGRAQEVLTEIGRLDECMDEGVQARRTFKRADVA